MRSMAASWRSRDSPSTNRSPQLLDLAALAIETPSWGYGDSGTRFATFQQPGRPRDVYERIDDAAEVHRLTGTAPGVALHFPWDAVDDLRALRAHIEDRGLYVGAVNPNLFQDPDYKLGSITHPAERVRRKAVEHLLECVEIAEALGSTAQSLWFADGTNYPGQDDLRARRRRLLESLTEVYTALPQEQQLLVEYKPFEPAAAEELPRLTIDQAHNIEPKVEAMVLSILNLQEASAKALLVDRDALAQVQREGDVLAGHRILLDAFQTDVRPHCAQARAALGAAEDAIAELRASGYAGRRAAERGEGESVAGGWGR